MTIEALRAAYAASTPEEWKYSQEGIDAYGVLEPDGTLIMHIQALRNSKAARMLEANTQFIALAHNMMPQLLEAADMMPRLLQAVDLLYALERAFGEQIDNDEPIDGADAVEWLCEFISDEVRPFLNEGVK